MVDHVRVELWGEAAEGHPPRRRSQGPEQYIGMCCSVADWTPAALQRVLGSRWWNTDRLGQRASLNRQCLCSLGGVLHFLTQTPSMESSGPLVRWTSVFLNDSVTEHQSRVGAGPPPLHLAAVPPHTLYCTWLFEKTLQKWYVAVVFGRVANAVCERGRKNKSPESFKEGRPWSVSADGASVSAGTVSRAPGGSNRDLEHSFCFVTVSIGTAALQWNKARLDVNTETITLSP